MVEPPSTLQIPPFPQIWGWEPITCHDGLDVQLQNVGDMHISEVCNLSSPHNHKSLWNPLRSAFFDQGIS